LSIVSFGAVIVVEALLQLVVAVLHDAPGGLGGLPLPPGLVAA
jgi:hypothetical protein